MKIYANELQSYSFLNYFFKFYPDYQGPVQALQSDSSWCVKHHFQCTYHMKKLYHRQPVSTLSLHFSLEKPKNFPRILSFQNSELILYPFLIVHWGQCHSLSSRKGLLGLSRCPCRFCLLAQKLPVRTHPYSLNFNCLSTFLRFPFFIFIPLFVFTMTENHL